MPTVPLIKPTHQFNGDNSAADPVDAAELDSNLSNICNAFNSEVIARRLTVNDNGGIANQSIRFPALHPEVITAMSGITFLQVVAAIATTNISLSGLQTIDGYSVLAGNRVLVNAQTSAVANGIYVASSGAWSYASDYVLPLTANTAVQVLNGASFIGSTWMLKVPVTPGSTATQWVNTGLTSNAGLAALAGNNVFTGSNSFTQSLGAISGESLTMTETGAAFSGTMLSLNMGTTSATAPQFLQLNYAGNQLLYFQPLPVNSTAGIAYDFEGFIRATTTGSWNPLIFRINANCQVNAGVVMATWSAAYIEACRSHSVSGDDGEVQSLIGLQITTGHDTQAGTPLTDLVAGLYIRLRRNTGTIGNMFGLQFDLKEVGGTVTGNIYGLYDDSTNHFSGSNPSTGPLIHLLSGNTAFGAVGIPSFAVHVLAGCVQTLGTQNNTYNWQNNVTNGSVASVFTPNSGPTGASTNIAGWIRINVQGTDGIMPWWQITP